MSIAIANYASKRRLLFPEDAPSQQRLFLQQSGHTHDQPPAALQAAALTATSTASRLAAADWQQQMERLNVGGDQNGASTRPGAAASTTTSTTASATTTAPNPISACEMYHHEVEALMKMRPARGPVKPHVYNKESLAKLANRIIIVRCLPHCALHCFQLGM